MKILFRVDAGGNVGLGHFYRSITLARKLREDEHEVVFSFLMSPFWSAQIEAGFDFLVKPIHEAGSEEETLSYIETHGVDVYYVDAILDFSVGFLERLREICKVIFYQNMSTAGPRADIFIYPSLRVNPEFFRLFDCRPAIYRGLEYVVYHPDIYLIPKRKRFSGKVRCVAVSAGGSDPLDTLRRIYGIVRSNIFNSYKFIFFYGNDYAFKSDIPQDLPPNVAFHMFDHREILHADVLLTAFGVSTYEFLCLGMPVIAFGHQDNNAVASDDLARTSGAIISLGEIGTVSESSVVDALLKISRPDFRNKMLQRASLTIDMDGVSRVAKILETSCC